MGILTIFNKPKPETVLTGAPNQISKAVGDSLASLILFGGTREELTDYSKLNDLESIRLLIVLNSVDTETLDKLAIGCKKMLGQIHSPMVMTLEEMRASTDVFPITFLEMKRSYRVLVGTDVLAELPIRFLHLRLRCEQELKNLLLRMQSRYLTLQDDRRLFHSMKTSFRSFTRTTSAASLLFDKDPPVTTAATLDNAAEVFGFDRELLENVSVMCTSRAIIAGELLRSTYATLMAFVSHAAQVVDQLPEEVSIIEIVEDEGGSE